jgi:alkylhydroperoxidase/carboxymuconolactone decarboxylase family protein YurZ
VSDVILQYISARENPLFRGALAIFEEIFKKKAKDNKNLLTGVKTPS